MNQKLRRSTKWLAVYLILTVLLFAFGTRVEATLTDIKSASFAGQGPFDFGILPFDSSKGTLESVAVTIQGTTRMLVDNPIDPRTGDPQPVGVLIHQTFTSVSPNQFFRFESPALFGPSVAVGTQIWPFGYTFTFNESTDSIGFLVPSISGGVTTPPTSISGLRSNFLDAEIGINKILVNPEGLAGVIPPITTAGVIIFQYEYTPENILVLDINAPTGLGGIFRVDPSTGVRTVFSDFDDAAQGLRSVTGPMEVDISGDILAIGSDGAGNNAVIRIDPVTGFRTFFLDLSDLAKGPRVISVKDMVVDATGVIFMLGSSSTGSGIIRVDPSTGFRAVLSDFDDDTKGPLVVTPNSIAIDALGNILVTDSRIAAKGVLLRVSPNVGIRTVLSDFGDNTQGPLGASPYGVAVDGTGNIFVTDIGTNSLYKVDPSTGDRTEIIDFADFRSPRDVTVNASGDVFIVDPSLGPNPFRGALYWVDPLTGNSNILSNFSDPNQGPLGLDPMWVAVVLAELNNTPAGINVVVELFDTTTDTLVTVTFPEVTRAGTTTLTPTTEGPPLPENYAQALEDVFYDLSTNAVSDVSADNLLGVFLKLGIVDPGDTEDVQVMVRVAEEWIPLSTQAESVESGVKVTFTLSIEHLKTSLFGIFKPVKIPVAIDIKPGSYPNSINLGSNGNVPVAILSTAEFDATTVDPTTVTLANAAVKLKGKGTPMASFEDVNGDGLLDLVVHVSTESLEITESDEEALLRGKVFGGAPIVVGSDTIRVVP